MFLTFNKKLLRIKKKNTFKKLLEVKIYNMNLRLYSKIRIHNYRKYGYACKSQLCKQVRDLPPHTLMHELQYFPKFCV